MRIGNEQKQISWMICECDTIEYVIKLAKNVCSSCIIIKHIISSVRFIAFRAKFGENNLILIMVILMLCWITQFVV